MYQQIKLGEETHGNCDVDTLTICDNVQPSVTLVCDKRNALVASYHGILHGNVGRLSINKNISVTMVNLDGWLLFTSLIYNNSI